MTLLLTRARLKRLLTGSLPSRNDSHHCSNTKDGEQRLTSLLLDPLLTAPAVTMPTASIDLHPLHALSRDPPSPDPSLEPPVSQLGSQHLPSKTCQLHPVVRLSLLRLSVKADGMTSTLSRTMSPSHFLTNGHLHMTLPAPTARHRLLRLAPGPDPRHPRDLPPLGGPACVGPSTPLAL